MNSLTPRYPWERFVYDSDNHPVEFKDGGFLVDPKSTFAKYSNPEVTSAIDSNLDQISCVALLGEPGVGKTDVINEHCSALRSRWKDTTTAFLQIDVQDIESESDFEDRILAHPEWIRWTKSNHNLVLIIDGIDEGMIRAKFIGTRLVKILKEATVDTLFLRISCRSADWPSNLSKSLNNIFRKKGFKELLVAPLSKENVKQAAQSEGVDGAQFLADIISMNIEAWALKPITLKFLLSVYKTESGFPADVSKLFISGCRHLAEYQDDFRKEGQIVGTLDVNERIALASKIAAITIFCDKSSIWIGASANAPKDSIPFTLCAGSAELTENGQTLKASEAALLETFKTALFIVRADQVFWAHRAYAEFLAAWYLYVRKLSIESVRNLLIHSESQGVVLQTRNTALYYASLNEKFNKVLLTVAPETVIAYASEKKQIKDPEFVLKGLINAARNGKVRPWSLNSDVYRQLKFDGIEQVILEVLRDRKQSRVVLLLAIDVIQSCELSKLHAELIDIIVTPRTHADVRAHAIHALGLTRLPECAVHLMHLLLEEVDSEIKTEALKALFPDFLTWGELEPYLQDVGPDNIRRIICRTNTLVGLDSLVDALNWAGRLEALKTYGPVYETVTFILKCALNSFRRDDVVASFVIAVAKRLDVDHTCDFDISEEYGTKKHLFEGLSLELRKQLLERFSTVRFNSGVLSLSWNAVELFDGIDLRWLVLGLQNADKESKSVWASWISRRFRGDNREENDLIITTCQGESELAKIMNGFIAPVELNSERAKELKLYHEYSTKRPVDRKAKALISEKEILNQISNSAEEVAKGNLTAWGKLCHYLCINEDGRTKDRDLADVSQSPWWPKDQKIIEKILTAAQLFILNYEPRFGEWLGKNLVNNLELEAFRALVILKRFNKNYFDSMEDSVWKKWAPITIAFVRHVSLRNDELEGELMSVAFEKAPDEFASALQSLLLESAKESGPLQYLLSDRLSDPRLLQIYYEQIEKDNLKPEYRDLLMEHLVSNGYAPAIQRALHDANEYDTAIEEKSRKAIVAMLFLLQHHPESFESVYGIISKNDVIARTIIEQLSDGYRRTDKDRLVNLLTEEQLSVLYLLVVKLYPYSDDIKHPENVYTPTIRDDIQLFRDQLLLGLVNNGTTSAVRLLKEIAQKLPQNDFLIFQIRQAENIASQLSWRALSLTEFYDLLSNTEARIVRIGDDLIKVVIESLMRLEIELQRENPQVGAYWDNKGTARKPNWYPKEENDVTDLMLGHLRKDIAAKGVVLGREVEIRRNQGKDAKGQSTDIYISAVVANEQADVVKVVLEAKGCWHRELTTAMKTQLRDRYLLQAGLFHGIYLVYWFHCKAWKPKKQSKPRSIEEAKRQFVKQARALSGDCQVESFVLDIRRQ